MSSCDEMSEKLIDLSKLASETGEFFKLLVIFYSARTSSRVRKKIFHEITQVSNMRARFGWRCKLTAKTHQFALEKFQHG